MRKFSTLIFHPLDLQIVHVTPLEVMLVLGFAGDLFECGGGSGVLLRQKHCSPSALMGLQSLMAQARPLCIACTIHTKHHSHVSPSGGQFTDSWNVAFMEQNLEKKLGCYRWPWA